MFERVVGVPPGWKHRAAPMVTTGMVTIDATVLATAVPSIARDIGGFTSFPWLFSIYLRAQAVAAPVCAKLSDTVGRKPIIVIALFLDGTPRIPRTPGSRCRGCAADVDHHCP